MLRHVLQNIAGFVNRLWEIRSGPNFRNCTAECQLPKSLFKKLHDNICVGNPIILALFSQSKRLGVDNDWIRYRFNR